jgi:hypothetical protein
MGPVIVTNDQPELNSDRKIGWLQSQPPDGLGTAIPESELDRAIGFWRSRGWKLCRLQGYLPGSRAERAEAVG